MTVPTYGLPRVGESPLPTARQNPEQSPSAFGVPKSPDLRGAADQYTDMQQREQDHADQMVSNAAELAMANLRTDVLTKAVSAKGINALGASQQASEDWNKGLTDIVSSLPPTNDRVRQAVANRAAGYWANAHEAIESHAHAEGIKADTMTTQALLNQGLQAAAANPETADDQVEIAKARVADYGARQGWSQPVIEQNAAQHASNIHAAVISQLIEQGTSSSYDQAKQYFDDHSDELLGEQKNDAEAQVDTASSESAGLKAAQSVMQVGPKTPQKATGLDTPAQDTVPVPTVPPNAPQPTNPPQTEEEAYAQLNTMGLAPKELAAAQRQVSEMFAVHRRSIVDTQRQNFQTLSDALAQNGKIPRASLAWSAPGALAPNERAALEAEEQRKLHPPHAPATEDFQRAWNLYTLHPDQFATEDLRADYSGASSSEFSIMMRAQAATAHASQRADATEAKQRITEPWKFLGSSPSPGVADQIRRLSPARAGGVIPPSVGNVDLSQPAVPQNPTASLLHPVDAPIVPMTKHPTKQQIVDAGEEPGYAAYLRKNGYIIP